jgi:uncharacterized membrane protein
LVATLLAVIRAAAWLSVLVLIAGVSARFLGLDRKFYWVDEVYSSVHIVGKTTNEIRAAIAEAPRQGLTLGDLRRLIEEPAEAGSPSDTISALARDDPHHPPLYYLVARAWRPIAGSDPVSLRLLSALISLLSLPALWWLCRELGSDPALAAMVVGLFAISPLHFINAQEVREYALWTALIAASTAAQLLALRTGRPRHWLVSAAFQATALYTSLLSMPLVGVQLVYAWWSAQTARERRLAAVAAFLVALAFLPWLWVVLRDGERILRLNDTSAEPIATSLYAETFLLNLSRIYLDLGLPSYQPLADRPMAAIAVGAIVALEAAALGALRARPVGRRVLLMLGLSLAGTLAFTALDLLVGGRRALIPRYSLPFWLALHIAVITSLSIGFASELRWRRSCSAVAFLLLAACGLVSVASYLPSRTWWTSRPPPLAEAAIRARDLRIHAIVAPTDLTGMGLLSLAESLPPETAVELYDPASRPRSPPDAGVVLYAPPASVLDRYAAEGKLRELSAGSRMWVAAAP